MACSDLCAFNTLSTFAISFFSFSACIMSLLKSRSSKSSLFILSLCSFSCSFCLDQRASIRANTKVDACSIFPHSKATSCAFTLTFSKLATTPSPRALARFVLDSISLRFDRVDCSSPRSRFPVVVSGPSFSTSLVKAASTGSSL